MQTPYLLKRLAAIGLDHIPTIALDNAFSQDAPVLDPIFEATPEGFCIKYYTPMGGHAFYESTFTDPKTGKTSTTKKPLKRIRYAPGFDEKMKYKSEYGSGTHPYYTTQIIEKFKNKTPIDRLILIEGEIKALACCLQGIDAVGLIGIYGSGDSESKDPTTGKQTRFHWSLLELIEVCKVKHLIFITDADTFVLKPSPGKDLTKRPYDFYNSVYRFAQFAQEVTGEKKQVQSLVFKAIKRSYVDRAKGLDDLFTYLPTHAQTIADEAQKLKGEHIYFDSYPITALATDKDKQTELKKAFGIYGPKIFYDVYKLDIGEAEFKYGRGTYKNMGTYVKMLAHDDGDAFLRVGDKWFKKITTVNQFDEIEEILETFGISEIQRDFENEKGNNIPGFINSLKRYDSFVNVPDFTPNYKRTWHGSYNLANPLPHLNNLPANQGSITSILTFLAHLCNTQADGNFTEHGIVPKTSAPLTVLVDWLTVALRYPTQKLPVPVLVSSQNSTGKSTFLDFLAALFGTNNAVTLNNEQFKTSFNSHYITKFIIGIDEGFIESEKRSEKEAIKQLITSKTQMINFKGVNRKSISYHGHVVLTGNDEKRIIQMDDTEDRWFVLKVPQYAKEDPNLLQKMRAEMPAFVKYLFERQIHHPHKTRFWFAKEHYITKQFKIIVASTRSWLEQNLDDFIEDMFVLINPPTGKLTYDVRLLVDELNKVSKYKVDASQIKTYLREKRALQKAGNGYHRMQVDVDSNGAPISTNRNCNPYIFWAHDWLTEADFNRYYPQGKERYSLEAHGQTKTLSSQEVNEMALWQATATTKTDDDLPF